MIIDAHNHPDWHSHNLPKFLENMKKYNIDKTWLLTWECPMHEVDLQYSNVLSMPLNDKTPIPFERALTYVEKAPDKFVLGYAPDPRLPDAIDKLEAAVEIYGVRIYGELKVRMMFDNLDAIRMYKYCGEKGLPITVHIDYEFDRDVKYPRKNYWYGGGIEPFERAVAACPGATFLGHGPGFWAHMSNDDQYDKVAYPLGKVVREGKITHMLRKYPNLYCDLSAGSGCNSLNRDPEHAVDFLTEFQDRVLYARDYFDNIHQECINSLGLPKDILDKLYYKNALKLLGE